MKFSQTGSFSHSYAKKGSLGTLVRGVSCDLKVTGSSCEIGHWKQVRPPTIHPLGCGPYPDLAYAGCFVHWAVLFSFVCQELELEPAEL